MKPSLVIIGLGNPGEGYARTRHNAGFQAIDVLAKAFGQGPWKEKDRLQSDIQEARIVAAPVLLVKPRTFMNLSGDAVRKVVDFYKLQPSEQVLVISDDIDLPLGETRLRVSGGPGTHNGLKSVVAAIGEGFPRLRIGLGTHPQGADLATWVLSVPSQEESHKISQSLEALPGLLTSFVMEKPPPSV